MEQQNYYPLFQALNAFRELFVKKYLNPNVVEHSKHFFREVSSKPLEQWSYNDAFRLFNLIKPYATKLKLVGFDFSTVPAVALPVARQEQRKSFKFSKRCRRSSGALSGFLSRTEKTTTMLCFRCKISSLRKTYKAIRSAGFNRQNLIE